MKGEGKMTVAGLRRSKSRLSRKNIARRRPRAAKPKGKGKSAFTVTKGGAVFEKPAESVPAEVANHDTTAPAETVEAAEAVQGLLTPLLHRRPLKVPWMKLEEEKQAWSFLAGSF